MEALRAIDDWGAGAAAAGVVRADGEVAVHGPRDRAFGWASVTKLLTGLAVLVAVEEGIVDLDEPAGPPDRPCATCSRTPPACPRTVRARR